MADDKPLEKGFFSKTKVKIAVAHAVAVMLVTFAQVMLEQNDMGMSPEVFAMILGAITTVVLTMLGAHTVTDKAATVAKINMAGTLNKNAIVTEVAKAVMKSKLGDEEDPS